MSSILSQVHRRQRGDCEQSRLWHIHQAVPQCQTVRTMPTPPPLPPSPHLSLQHDIPTSCERLFHYWHRDQKSLPESHFLCCRWQIWPQSPQLPHCPGATHDSDCLQWRNWENQRFRNKSSHRQVKTKHRRIPFHVRKDVERELERLENEDIIEKVEGPTPLVSPTVTVPKKDGGVRLYIDMREANKAIKREKHPMPTLDDVIADLNGSTDFSKLDLSGACHQLELAEDSRYITTFSTHVGLRRYKRLLFGVNAASEIFQNAIAEILQDVPGSRNISDDIIVHWKTQAEHDESLRATLKRLW